LSHHNQVIKPEETACRVHGARANNGSAAMWWKSQVRVQLFQREWID
jgi:hypothetical protein